MGSNKSLIQINPDQTRIQYKIRTYLISFLTSGGWKCDFWKFIVRCWHWLMFNGQIVIYANWKCIHGSMLELGSSFRIYIIKTFIFTWFCWCKRIKLIKLVLIAWLQNLFFFFINQFIVLLENSKNIQLQINFVLPCKLNIMEKCHIHMEINWKKWKTCLLNFFYFFFMLLGRKSIKKSEYIWT